MSGIYIHIPFCKQACHYCDFHFSTGLGTKDRFLNALEMEIQLRKDYLQVEIQTVYFGGGTPSILGASELKRILDTLRSHFIFSENIECTLEANPDDLDEAKLTELKELGINRLSIGIQSYHDSYLRFFNRAHDAQMARDCMPAARNAGFENISIDLIFGIPDQSLGQLKSDLEQAVQSNPDHISIYGLTIEEKTAFGNWYKKGKLKPLDEESSADQFELIMAFLKDHGFHQYEISNFAKPRFESKHNSSYWSGQHYLGLGPSAHSYNGATRQHNIPNNSRYSKSLEEGTVPATVETLTATDKINETILTRLRTSAGLDLEWLHHSLGHDLESNKPSELGSFIQSGWLQLEDNKLYLTDAGKLLADEITEKLII